ncbi:ATP-binding protein [Treponema denticola]|uniref:ATP-binding protein n=1 Tax=Treponema denticola TaxID=158 RepID=UPI002103F826|nr:ATP-binding protein [Treponema denticola]UTY23438.1 AAA family ATPase [Treponema denticola]
MPLNKNVKALLETLITENEYLSYSIRRCITKCLNDDTKEANADFITQMKTKLMKQPVKLPSNIEDKVICYPSDTFICERYYVHQNWIDSVLQSIIKMKAVSEIMDSMRIHYHNSTILYGESGTGKTEFARYVAYRLNLPLFYLNFSNLVDSALGKTAKNIASVFSYAKKDECILMLDEIDCIAGSRNGADGAEKELSRVTITLMQELDMLPNNVILIAATNRLNDIDDAVLNRFSIKQKIERLSLKNNIEFARFYVKAIHAENYINDIDITECINEQNLSQRQVVTKIIQLLGDKLYQSLEDKQNAVK